MAFQPARNEIPAVVFLEWSGIASLAFLLSEHCIPPVAVLRGSPALCYVTKAVCSMDCLWEQKPSDPELCLSACQLSPSPQASGDPANISDLGAGPFQLHQDRREVHFHGCLTSSFIILAVQAQGGGIQHQGTLVTLFSLSGCWEFLGEWLLFGFSCQ